MRTTWRIASVLATVTVLWWAAPTESQPHDREESKPPAQTPAYEADCRTVVDGSRATAYCHNAYPGTDRVRLHIECERWWDVDVDGGPVALAPAGYVQLTDRCWKEIRTAWVSHQPLPDDAGT
ncbi:hypothetical protein OG883_20135 [Streptomyces sp. NBC_01142]|uniref:hypothetical protein n=1 Tax=Streptomyces sp. NBC_01142 TaxID=2975865 RepID=UPI002250EA56|nr:hypothetical protein [Streptomyces sp. NBC_01142]MCX4822153.1 hypothetical protein [Streptomyces sp. NBC_01142]